MVIGSVATEIYVMVLMFLVDWHSKTPRLVGVNAFYTCCMSCFRN